MSRHLSRADLGRRAKCVTVKQIGRKNLEVVRESNKQVMDEYERPSTREDCRDQPRPCPWVACKHHLYLDINPETGSIKINFPDLEPWEMQHTCALDVAERGGITLEEVGEIMNLTRERIRQVEVRGLIKLKTARTMRELGGSETVNDDDKSQEE